MRSLICLLIPLQVLLHPWAHGAETTSADLLSDPFVENYKPEVEVSGNVIVGVMSATAAASLASDRLSVRSPQAPGPTDICLRATSSDGIYTSRNHYRLPAAAPAPIHLPYRSSMGDILSRYRPGDVAISANTGDCESSSTEYFVVTSLDSNAPTQTRIYLNSFGATDVFYQIEGAGQPAQTCEYIAEGRRTSYDFFCTLALDHADAVAIDIIRERFGREQPGVQLKLIGIGQ